MDALLNIENLSVGYGKNTVLSGVTFQVNRGEMVGVIGRNGAGKTTLLRTLSGLQPPLAGAIQVAGKNLYNLSPKKRASLVSIVLTQRILLQGIKVRELLEMGRFPSLHALPFLRKSELNIEMLVQDCLAKLNISHLAEKPLAQISDGELQKAMIARSLVQKTPLILMDEPTAFLDYIAKEELFAELKKLVSNENIAILFSSHDLEMVEKYSDKILHVEKSSAQILSNYP